MNFKVLSWSFFNTFILCFFLFFFSFKTFSTMSHYFCLSYLLCSTIFWFTFFFPLSPCNICWFHYSWITYSNEMLKFYISFYISRRLCCFSYGARGKKEVKWHVQVHLCCVHYRFENINIEKRHKIFKITEFFNATI